jgi:voltage-gated potassium channel
MGLGLIYGAINKCTGYPLGSALTFNAPVIGVDQEKIKANYLMGNIKSRLKIYLVIFFAVIVLGTIGMMSIEKNSLIDSFYFIIVTMATVGYGDIHPVTNFGKIFTLFIIVTGVGTFLGVIANFTEIMLEKREIESRMEKLNMIIGVFYSEVGLELLSRFASYDPDFDAIRGSFIITGAWKDKEFIAASKESMKHDFGVDVSQVDFLELKDFLAEKRDFLLRLLENPVLMEHQSFTDLLRAVFHLTEELAYRNSLEDVPKADANHLAGDIKRSYHLIVAEWIIYLKYLKNNYPFLFSLAVRTNPFNKEASVVVTVQ